MLKIWLANLGKYNEGCLVGKWVELPIDLDAELPKILLEIGINEYYEEYAVFDYDTDIPGASDEGEYPSIEFLNELAMWWEDADTDKEAAFEAYLAEYSDSIRDAIDFADRGEYYVHGTNDMTDIAREYVEWKCDINRIPLLVQNAIDWNYLAQELKSYGHYVELGNCIVEFFE